MILEGNLYSRSQKGWQNTGKKSIEFHDKIKELPVHSRCHLLLKDQKESDEEKQTSKQTKQLHCVSLSPPKQRSQVHRNQNGVYFASKIKLLTNSSQGCLIPEKENTLDKSPTNSLRPTIRKKSHEIKNSIDFTTYRSSSNEDDSVNKLKEREKQLLQMLEKQKKSKQDLERDYNTLLKEALKRNFHIMDDNKNRISEISENTAKNTDEREIDEKYSYQLPSFSEVFEKQGKNMDSPQTKKTSFIDDQGTERIKTRPRVIQESDSGDSLSHYQHNYDNVPTYRPQYRKKIHQNNFETQIFQQKIKVELQNISKKISNFESQLINRQNKYKQQIMQKNLEERDREIEKLMREKILLSDQSKISNQDKSNRTDISTRNQKYEPVLFSFILFVLGMVVAKSFLC